MENFTFPAIMYTLFLRVSKEHLTVNNGYCYVLVNAFNCFILTMCQKGDRFKSRNVFVVLVSTTKQQLNSKGM